MRSEHQKAKIVFVDYRKQPKQSEKAQKKKDRTWEMREMVSSSYTQSGRLRTNSLWWEGFVKELSFKTMKERYGESVWWEKGTVKCAIGI